MSERKAVVALVLVDGKVLLGKKKEDGKSILSGQWHILGETLEEGETDEQALERGVLEEAGILVRPKRYLATHITIKGTEVNWYECETSSTDIRSGSDLEEVRWVPFDDVEKVCDKNAISLWTIEIREYFQK